ncbi:MULTISPECIES: CehA/McbA family metallohydrolase [unclassified Crossiella]|uniref:CehA/McbA family metallohydrolase n=1 Tax=unclassified Crossiella TaxID=2620835 RepID=UPI001FFE5405|nr:MULTISPECIES: CehA/McbA family metallohydrolase [unclassified Crossiella]MCK2240292.1 CehA/McbA family metallohydrolase [Crossiella sp. S99.2]MCK2253256.1 CehA/McbA family metallohydrolase [Crossiella sp. S99.1]
MIIHSGLITREQRSANRWLELPFEVPAGCAGITVELTYADPAILDIGCAGPAGWRGWSGSARRRFAITAETATPGYLPGEPEPGEWRVVLGLHRIPPEGAHAQVEVTLGPAFVEVAPPAPLAPAPRPVRQLPATAGLRWIPADLHSHTLHSDGKLTVPELAALAVSRGLSALAVTDHNTVAHHAELAEVGDRYGIALIPGQEVTTDSGHANAFGDIGWIDFRRPPAEWLSTVEERGGLLSINHPLSGDCSWRDPMPVRPPLAEIWHSSWWSRTWGGPLAFWRSWGMHVTPVGGSDFHGRGADAEPGNPTTWLAVDENAYGPGELAKAALDALRAGRTAISANPDAPVLLPVDGDLMLVGASGALLYGPDGSRCEARTEGRLPAAGPGGHVLTDHEGGMITLCGNP